MDGAVPAKDPPLVPVTRKWAGGGGGSGRRCGCVPDLPKSLKRGNHNHRSQLQAIGRKCLEVITRFLNIIEPELTGRDKSRISVDEEFHDSHLASILIETSPCGANVEGALA